MAEPTLASKLCNFLVEDATLQASRAGMRASSVAITRGILAVARLFGGAWVGGRAVLTSDRLVLSPNSMNRGLTGNTVISIPLSEITSLTLEWGFVTGIICIGTEHRVVKMRCWGRQPFIDLVAPRCPNLRA